MHCLWDVVMGEQRTHFGWPNQNVTIQPSKAWNASGNAMEFNKTVNKGESDSRAGQDGDWDAHNIWEFEGKQLSPQSVKNHKCYISIGIDEKTKCERRRERKWKETVKTNKMTRDSRDSWERKSNKLRYCYDSAAMVTPRNPIKLKGDIKPIRALFYMASFSLAFLFRCVRSRFHRAPMVMPSVALKRSSIQILYRRFCESQRSK